MDLTVYKGTHGITRGDYLQQVEITARRGDPFNMETTEAETKTKTKTEKKKQKKKEQARRMFSPKVESCSDLQ